MFNAKTGLAIATAAAAMFALGATPAAHAGDDATVKCAGVNTCKGTSDCKSGNHDCKGQNDCIGQGFKEMTAKACKTAGGSLTAPN